MLQTIVQIDLELYIIYVLLRDNCYYKLIAISYLLILKKYRD